MSIRAAAILLLLLAPWVPVAAADPPGTTFETGGVTIWYEVRGTASGTPLIVANGGPGFDHNYLLCGDVWDTLAERDAEIVFYDQRGNGRSSVAEGRAALRARRSRSTISRRSAPTWASRRSTSSGTPGAAIS